MLNWEKKSTILSNVCYAVLLTRFMFLATIKKKKKKNCFWISIKIGIEEKNGSIVDYSYPFIARA